MSELRFRDLHTADEFRQVMALEQEVWGFTDLNDMVTVPVFTITTKRGAILIGAYDAAERMVGFVYSIVGMKARGRCCSGRTCSACWPSTATAAWAGR